jgi:hypothetical protein
LTPELDADGEACGQEGKRTGSEGKELAENQRVTLLLDAMVDKERSFARHSRCGRFTKNL